MDNAASTRTSNPVVVGATVDFDELRAAEGRDLGSSEWMSIDQHRIDTFADAVDDHQWIHVDPVRTAAAGLDGTIAHGYLTLGAAGTRIGDLLQVTGAIQVINYGVDRARFPAPLPSGRRIRTSGSISRVTEVAGGLQVAAHLVTEAEDVARPVCVADVVVRYLKEDG